ncbi:ABC transporter permease [Actinobacillus equuli]|nr:ABC transporter permease [Actinobacillus equuli]
MGGIHPSYRCQRPVLIKETSVISAVAVAELMFITKDIIGMDYKTNEALFLLFASYLVIYCRFHY